MHFDFATANRIVFEAGSVTNLIDYVKDYGKCCLFVIGTGNTVSEAVIHSLMDGGIETLVFHVYREPDIEVIDQGVKLAKEHHCEFVVSLGGGSVIDAGKAIAAMVTNDGSVIDYLEIVGKGISLRNAPIPFVAVPTTAGTGSEVTRNAVLSVNDKKVKVSLRHPLMLPRVALIDPELTFSMPKQVTASTGMDALCQVMEPFVSSRANRMTDLYCREGMHAVSIALLNAYQDGNNAEARTQMSWASLLGGIALANSGLGAVHGFAGPIGGMFDAPHGAICACLLPYVVEVNIRALVERSAQHIALDRYQEIAVILTHEEGAGFGKLNSWLLKMIQELKIPTLADFGITPRHFDQIIEKAAVASSMKANPVKLETHELRSILDKAY